MFQGHNKIVQRCKKNRVANASEDSSDVTAKRTYQWRAVDLELCGGR